MPVVFVGHGSPMNAILDNKWSRGFKELGRRVRTPKAVLSVSAHWYVPGTFLTGNRDPKTIHDFEGFPRELHEVEYPAPGDPGLANRVGRMLSSWNATARSDWGIDHGTWSVLRHMFPRADIPVVQLSIDGRATAEDHLEMGRLLGPLRDEGILILGSGNLVHNLRSAFQQMQTGSEGRESWATEFDDRVAGALQDLDVTRLAHACDDELGGLAHPSPDHFLPVLYTTGAAGKDAEVEFPLEGFDLGSISMRTVLYR